MKQVILSCPTLKKEILHLIDELNLDTPVYFLPKRLHSNPQELAGVFAEHYRQFCQRRPHFNLRKRLRRRNGKVKGNYGGACNTQNARLRGYFAFQNGY